MRKFEHTVVVSPCKRKWKVCYWDEQGKVASTVLSQSSKVSEVAQKIQKRNSENTEPEVVFVTARGELWDFDWIVKNGYAQLLRRQDNYYHKIEDNLLSALIELREAKEPLSGRTLSEDEEKVMRLSLSVVSSEITLRAAYRKGFFLS